MGSKYGGDGRCGSQTARSAFVVVAGPEDVNYSHLDLRVIGIDKGGKNATKVLENAYRKRKKQLSVNDSTEVFVLPKNGD